MFFFLKKKNLFYTANRLTSDGVDDDRDNVFPEIKVKGCHILMLSRTALDFGNCLTRAQVIAWREF